MKNEEVIKNFLQKKNARNLNLHTQHDGNKFVLVNYETPIAHIEGTDLWLNKCKYSPTTSKIQGQLAYQATQTDYTIVEYNQDKIDKKGGRR